MPINTAGYVTLLSRGSKDKPVGEDLHVLFIRPKQDEHYVVQLKERFNRLMKLDLFHTYGELFCGEGIFGRASVSARSATGLTLLSFKRRVQKQDSLVIGGGWSVPVSTLGGRMSVKKAGDKTTIEVGVAPEDKKSAPIGSLDAKLFDDSNPNSPVFSLTKTDVHRFGPINEEWVLKYPLDAGALFGTSEWTKSLMGSISENELPWVKEAPKKAEEVLDLPKI
jgi:hypothetical protein